MNRLLSTEGIILKNIKVNEADKIITIYSLEYGKIRGIAKGVRKTKSQFGSSLENLTISRIIIYRGKTINIINQTEIIDSFFSQTKYLFRYGLAIKCAEIVDKLCADEDSNKELFYLFKKYLLLLKDEKNPTLLTESFLWKLFSILGYKPELNKCVSCGKLPDKEEWTILDISKGGILCPNCCQDTNCFQIKIKKFHLKLLQRIIIADLDRIHNKEINQFALSDLVKLTETYLSYHFDIDNRSRLFLNKLRILQ